MPQAGFYEESPLSFVGCVPASACPSVDVSAIVADPSKLTLDVFKNALSTSNTTESEVWTSGGAGLTADLQTAIWQQYLTTGLNATSTASAPTWCSVGTTLSRCY